MHTPTDVIAGVGLRARPGKSRWPARMDLAQSLSGLVLGLFMWGHMFFVSSILLGNDAMWIVTKAFEGYFFFGRGLPGLVVAVVVAVVAALFVLHAFLAMRKFPANYRQYQPFSEPPRACCSTSDTTLWWVQVRHRLRALLPRLPAPVPDADAPGRDRPLRVGRPLLERALVAAVPGAAVRGRTARRHRPVPAGRQVGLAAGRRPRRRARAPEARQVGADGLLPRARAGHLRGLHEDRPRAAAPCRPRATRRPGCSRHREAAK